MPAPAEAGSYRAVLRLPSALRIFAPALAGRLAYGLLPLATLFTVSQTTGSYAAAGLAIALFGLTTVTLPLKARLTDRHPALLPLLALACAALLSGAALLPWPVPFVAAAGLAAPPLGPAMRSAWRSLTEGTTLKERAYALDAIAEETLYLVGPLLTGLLIAVAPARGALLLTAALLLTGTIGMTAAAPTRSPRTPQVAGTDLQRLLSRALDPGPLRSTRLWRVLAVLAVAGAGISVAFTAMAVAATQAGHPGAAGPLEAGVGAGSVVGGLLWARRRHTRPRALHFGGLLGLFGAGLLAAAAAPGLLVLGAVMTLAGVAVSPLYVAAYLAADDLTPPEHRTEAGTWVNVAANAGSAAGAAAAGLLTDRAGPSTAFLAAGTLLAATALAALLTSTRANQNRPGRADRTVVVEPDGSDRAVHRD
ncbi:MFS transporter [Paractinoplanes toevensis]|uniref:MFS transporter n=1 Tax=Paractinoplanes toevensis TaxID=571911 RepID=A0A919W833_9ACTN|nr:MFS transporter [Actinoplanes toevensis]GIM91761.1 MFS transporter [Actinoplanes toevensis]